MRTFFLILLVPVFLLADAYVAYEVSGGRFGDHLSDYLHGRWVEYKTGVPLIYTPFAFSDALLLHKKQNGVNREKIIFDRTIECHRDQDVLNNLSGKDNVLFWIPHFTTFSIDSVVNVPLGRAYFPKCFLVDWRDKVFLEIVREEISPTNRSLSLFTPPAGAISIALHYRDGGGVDRPEWLWCFPLRFPSKQFYKKALSDLITTLPQEEPLFIGIFTDSRKPKEVQQEFSDYLLKQFPGNRLQVVLSSSSKGDGAGVLEDFFSIESFEYVIGAESLYSQNAARLGKCRFSIRPQAFAQDCRKENVFAPTLIDMRYKTAKEDQILSFDPESGQFGQDLEAILKRSWYCYKRGIFFDLTLSHPVYERLNYAFLKPIERQHLIVPDETDLSLKEIDWEDPFFVSMFRSIWVPKMAFQLPFDRQFPSIAILDAVTDFEPYFKLVEEKGWKRHQVTLIFTGDTEAKKENLTTLHLSRKLKKLGALNAEVRSLSIKNDPLGAFIAIGFHDYVITTPSFFVETATKVFGPHRAIIVK